MGARRGPGRSAERPGLAVASLEQRDFAGTVSARLERSVLLEHRATLGSRGDGDRASGQIVDQRRVRRGGRRIHPILGRGALEISLPKGRRPAARLRWLVPERPNALERNRARAYQVAYATMVAYADLLKAFDYMRRG